MEKIIVAGIGLVLALALCCGGTTLAKVGIDSFYTDPTATPTPDPTVEKLREELDKDPKALADKLASDEAEDVDFEGIGDVPGVGTRDFFIINGNRLNCEEIGKDRPTRCFRIGNTHYWACNGQILRDCPECPEPTPPTSTPTGVVPTVTPTQQACCTAVPPTGLPPTATTTPIVPPTATTAPPTGVPTATHPLPTNGPTPEGTKECKCLDVKIDFGYEAKVEPNVFGTKVTDPGNGFMVFLGGVNDSFMETSWDDCQYFVGNAFRLDRDWGNPGQGPVQECVVFYHRGAGTIKINVTDGIVFHVDENRTGYNINESLAQNRDTLERGGYGCTRSNIKFIELKTYQ